MPSSARSIPSSSTVRSGGRDEQYEEPSPIDSDLVIGRFSQATTQDVDDAVAAAKAYQLEWDRTGWQERVRILRNVADIMEERVFDLAALMAYEVGKSRLEALGDVQETAELIRWNCDEMEKHDGFRVPMSGLGAAGDYYDVLRPHGVWAVISPFNFPMALSGGPSSGALVAGNTVVLKPSNQGALLGYKLYECYRDGGVPPGAFHLVIGRGVVAGDHLWHHPDVNGVTFTGSYPVGMDIYKHFSTDVPKPVICEMGGKNPTIVTGKADLDKATDGVMRSAFGFGGQKCSACSRASTSSARSTTTSSPSSRRRPRRSRSATRSSATSISARSSTSRRWRPTRRRPRKPARTARSSRAASASPRATLGRGLFVEPTVVEVPEDSWIWKKELFVPFVAVAPYDELDDAIEKANDTEYGLTAGFFSEDRAEIDEWLDRIHAGVVYVNRRAGSTTGAWPGVQPFGGWKGSGTTGKAGGGPYYVLQYLREQSRTVIEE